MNEEENPKQLETAAFTVHATRGVIRDRGMRRKMILILLVFAVVMLFAGSTVLQSLLDPREHGVRFVVYWGIVVWLTATIILLALYDLLMVRREERAARRSLQARLRPGSNFPDEKR